jgi:hypothetical protein
MWDELADSRATVERIVTRIIVSDAQRARDMPRQMARSASSLLRQIALPKINVPAACPYEGHNHGFRRTLPNTDSAPDLRLYTLTDLDG